MELTVAAENDGIFVVTCGPQMEWNARMALVEAVQAAAENRAVRGVLLDMQKVRFLSSAGLGAICNLLKFVRASGARLVLARPQATILRLLRTVELPKIVATTATLEEARDILAKDPAPSCWK